MSNIILLTCSPRANGNTDTVGTKLFKELNDALLPTEIIPLRSLTIRSCISCGFCITHPEQCFLEAKDEVGWLFDKICAANTLIIASPIFFYGPPAQLKSFIDRSQKYWNSSNYTLYEPIPDNPFLKPAFVTLLAARNKGNRVFEATLLILKCFFQCIGFSLCETLLLRNLDGPHDFSHSDIAQAQVSLFAKTIQFKLTNHTIYEK